MQASTAPRDGHIGVAAAALVGASVSFTKLLFDAVLPVNIINIDRGAHRT
jgi:hypothetical protein